MAIKIDTAERILSKIGTPEWCKKQKEFIPWCLAFFPEFFGLIFDGQFTPLEPSKSHIELMTWLGSCPKGGTLATVLGHRGFGKTVICSVLFTLWAALEQHENYPYIIVVTNAGNRETLAKTVMSLLEENALVASVYGARARGTWNMNNIILSNRVCISFKSVGQKIRGSLYFNHRPALIIGDDLEGDAKSQKNREQRDHMERYVRSEMIPALDTNGLLLIVGNVLHKDSLLPRLEKSNVPDKNGNLTWKVWRFPILDPDGNCNWPARWPTAQAIEDLKARAGNSAWQREYMLKATSEEEQPIKDSWIQFYDGMPETPDEQLSFVATGVDLAISKKDTADYTAMVSIFVYFDTKNQKHKFYVDPQPTIERLSFHEAIAAGKAQSMRVGGGSASLLFVENVGYQQAAVEEFQRQMLPVFPVSPGGQDKRARLTSVGSFIQSGAVLFPRRGADEVILQLTDFGVEEHDDASDAFVICMMGILQRGLASGEVRWV